MKLLPTLFDYLAHWAGRAPSKIALEDARRRYTYAEYAAAVARLGEHLAAAGISRGRAVAVIIPKSAALPVAYVGAAAAGTYPFPLDYKAPPAKLKAACATFAPAAALISRDTGGSRAEWETALGIPVTVVEDASETATGAELSALTNAAQADDVFYLNVTSGVTGRPKAAIATHANVIANADAACRALSLGPDDVHLCAFSAHAHPHETFARALVTGAAAAFAETLLPRSLLAAIERWRVTAFMAVPPLFLSLLESSVDADLTSLRLAEAGGMVTPSALARDIRAAWGIPLTRVWGSTETSGIAFVADAEAPEGTLGRPIAGYDVALRNEHGAAVTPGDVGELHVSGPACVTAFWRMGTPEKSSGAGIRTGDLLKQEPDGSFTFVDRLDGMMKTAGEKVYAGEIERVLRQYPGVADAAVVPVADPLRGEVPHAFVAPFDHVEIDAEELGRFARENLSPIKRPRRITIVPELPRAEGFKVDKRRLAGADDELTEVDEDLLRLLNRRAALRRESRPPLSPEQTRLRIFHLRKSNQGPLHDDTVEVIFRKLDELMGD